MAVSGARHDQQCSGMRYTSSDRIIFKNYSIHLGTAFAVLGFGISNLLSQVGEPNGRVTGSAVVQPAYASGNGSEFVDSAMVQWVQPTAGVSVAVDAADNVYTLDYVMALGAEMILTKESLPSEVLRLKFAALRK